MSEPKTLRFVVEEDGKVVYDEAIKAPPQLPKPGDTFTAGETRAKLKCVEVSDTLLRARPLTDEEREAEAPSVLDPDDLPIESETWGVASWGPSPDGSGSLTEVHLMQRMQLTLGDGFNPRLIAIARMKTRENVQAVIDALVKHRDSVFPEEHDDPAR